MRRRLIALGESVINHGYAPDATETWREVHSAARSELDDIKRLIRQKVRYSYMRRACCRWNALSSAEAVAGLLDVPGLSVILGFFGLFDFLAKAAFRHHLLKLTKAFIPGLQVRLRAAPTYLTPPRQCDSATAHLSGWNSPALMRA